MSHYLNQLCMFVIIIAYFHLHWTWDIMTRPYIASVLPTSGHWRILFKIPKNRSLCHNQHMPNDQIIAQSHHVTVPKPDMPSSSQQVKIFPDHTYKPLLSLWQLADIGYTFQGNHKHMMLTHPDHQSLCATRFPSSVMYLMSLTNPHPAPPPHTVPSMPTLQACSTRFNKRTNYLANNAFSVATKPDLAMYYHQAAFSPVPTKFITAINNVYLNMAGTYSRAHIKASAKEPCNRKRP